MCFSGTMLRNLLRNGISNRLFYATSVQSKSNVDVSVQESPHPKMVLNNFNALIKAVRKDYQEPKANFQMTPDRTWTCKLSITWPTKTEFTATAATKAKAERDAYAKLLQSLKTGGYFDEQGRPKFHSRTELKELEGTRCVKVNLSAISEELRSEIDEIKASAEELRSEIADLFDQKTPPILEPALEIEEKMEDELESETTTDDLPIESLRVEDDSIERDEKRGTSGVVDIITNKILEPLDERRFMERSHDLYTRFLRRKRRSVAMASAKSEDAKDQLALPIAEKRDEIIDLLSRNRALIIAGGTGCGKTTQVPQYIFDDCVQRLEGARCNILVTQPRRISAISVCQRVAWERYERLGDTVGYHVRLGLRLPVGHGSMLFVTPAMLLRKVWDNSNFEGLSHVIVDEVHERDLWTDFLLIVLKRALKTNEKLKVILMSASMDSKKLATYFDDCPIVTVEGKNFEVEEHFLDDTRNVTSTEATTSKNSSSDLAPTDHKIVVDTLSYIHQNKQDGAILCFLPSWSDIVKVRQMFQDRHDGRSDFALCACHSRLPLSEQEKIFKPLPAGVRKIVLATNIAETSITINDVRYVVNTGTRKNSFSDRNLKSIRQEFASQSAQIQRKGRAGRVSDGECFHLFTKSVFDQMKPFDVPAIVKEPLENVVLFSKLCCPNEDPLTLIQQALDTPPAAQIDCAIRLLIAMKILDNDRCLTTLGASVARLGCHPMLAKAMVYGNVFRCIEPVITLVAILQTDGLVQSMSETDNRSVSRELEAKERFVGNSLSDHLAQVNLYLAYQKSEANGNGEEFVREYGLRSDNLILCKALRRLFAWELSEIGLGKNADELLDPANTINENSGNSDLVKAVLAAGLHEQVVWYRKGVLDRGRILDKQLLTDESRYRYMTSGGSLFKSRSLAERDWSNWLFFYANKMLISGTRLFRADGLSALSPLTALLYGGHEPNHVGEGVVNLVGYYYQLRTNEEDVKRLLDLRNLIRDLVDWSLRVNAMKSRSDVGTSIEKINAINRRLTSLVGELTSKTCIDQEN